MPFLHVTATNHVDWNRYDAVINHEISAFMDSEEYKDHKAEKEQEYYEMYKNGELSHNGFSNKVAELDTVDYAYSVKDQFMSADEIKDVEEAMDSKARHYKITGIGTTCSILSSSALLAAYGIYDSIREKEKEEQEMSL